MKILLDDRKWGRFGIDSYRGHRFYAYEVTEVAVILPLLAGGRILIERQYRPQIKRYIYELPAGRVDRGEKSLQTAVRELKEETGYTASRVSPMAVAYSSPGITNEKLHMFIATGLRKGKSHLDDNEYLSVKTVTLKKAMQMVKKNQIVDAKTIAALLYYSAFVLKTG